MHKGRPGARRHRRGWGTSGAFTAPHRQIFQKWVCLVLLPELLIVMHYRSPRLGTKLLPY